MTSPPVLSEILVRRRILICRFLRPDMTREQENHLSFIIYHNLWKIWKTGWRQASSLVSYSIKQRWSHRYRLSVRLWRLWHIVRVPHVDTVQVPPRRAPQPRRALRRPRLCHRRAGHLGAGGVSRRLRPIFVGFPGRFQVVWNGWNMMKQHETAISIWNSMKDMKVLRCPKFLNFSAVCMISPQSKMNIQPSVTDWITITIMGAFHQWRWRCDQEWSVRDRLGRPCESWWARRSYQTMCLHCEGLYLQPEASAESRCLALSTVTTVTTVTQFLRFDLFWRGIRGI